MFHDQGADIVARRLLPGLQPARERLARQLESPLLAVTALNPELGYDTAARITRHATEKRITPREAAIALGLLDGQTFDRLVDLRRMAGG